MILNEEKINNTFKDADVMAFNEGNKALTKYLDLMKIIKLLTVELISSTSKKQFNAFYRYTEPRK